MRLSAQRRFQRRGAGRRGLLPDDNAQRHPLLDRGGLSQAGAPAAEPESRLGCACHPHRLRRPSRNRRRVSCRQRATQRQRQCRGDRRVGRIQFAAALAALRRRTGVASPVARNSDRRGCAGRRQRPQRPFLRPHHFALQGDDHRQQCDAQLGHQACLRRALRSHAPRLPRRARGLVGGFCPCAAHLGNAGFAMLDFAVLGREPSAATCTRSRA